MTDAELRFAIWAAQRMVRPGAAERRERLRALGVVDETDEQWAVGLRLAQEVVREYGHMLGSNGEWLPGFGPEVTPLKES